MGGSVGTAIHIFVFHIISIACFYSLEHILVISLVLVAIHNKFTQNNLTL